MHSRKNRLRRQINDWLKQVLKLRAFCQLCNNPAVFLGDPHIAYYP
jgi:hypothetical protein